MEMGCENHIKMQIEGDEEHFEEVLSLLKKGLCDETEKAFLGSHKKNQLFEEAF